MNTKTFTKVSVLPVLVFFIICLLILISKDTNTDNKHVVYVRKRVTIAVGILSSSNNFCLREAQRKLFVTQERAYNSLDIKVLFLLDHPTPELDKERRIYNDILYLNVTEHGWNNRFGKKLHT